MAPHRPRKIKAVDPNKKERDRNNKKSKAKVALATISASQLATLSAAQTKQHLLSSNTNTKYDGYLNAARIFLESLCEQRDQDKDSGPLNQGFTAGGDNDEDEQLREGFLDDDDINFDDPEFRKALDGPPSKYTPEAIRMFLTWKCFHEDNGMQTAWGIHSAWIKEYDSL